MAFEFAAALADIPEDEAYGVTVDRYDLALAKHGDEVFALQDLCSHANIPLSEGEVAVDADGTCTVECYLHGSTFDLRSGKPTCFPATEPVATFPVELRPNDSGAVDVYVDVTTTLNGVTPA